MAQSYLFQTSSLKYLLLVKFQFILLPKSSGGFHHTYTNTEINGASLLSICMYLRQLAHSNPTHQQWLEAAYQYQQMRVMLQLSLLTYPIKRIILGTLFFSSFMPYSFTCPFSIFLLSINKAYPYIHFSFSD